MHITKSAPSNALIIHSNLQNNPLQIQIENSEIQYKDRSNQEIL